jgi:hypothetical protein
VTTVAIPRVAGWPVVLVLAGKEARRLVSHPAMLVGWALLAFMFTVNALEPEPISAFDMISTGATFYPGLLCVLAAHMVTTRDRRAGTGELLGSVPATREQRVLALLLAAWVPAAVALVLNVLFRSYFGWQDVYVEAPSAAHVLQAPVTVLGGSLLGVMLALWLPQRVTPVLAMVALVAGSIALGSDPDRGTLLAPMVSWVDWGPYGGKAWYALESGNAGWHVIYLVGLCGLAGTAAWLRVTLRRWLGVGLGVGFLALTLWGGLAQLP